MRSAVLWLGLLLVAAGPGRTLAQEASPGPEPTVTGSLAEPALPEPPVAVVAIAAAAENRPVPAEVTVPEAAAASVVIPAADAIRGAIELRLGEGRLGDGKLSWPQRLPKKDRETVAAYYAAHGWRPLWVAESGFGPAGRRVADRLAHAAEDGLDPADYAAFATPVRPGGPADLAEADIRLSAAAALYARDARGGRIDITRLSPLITPKLELPAADAVLAALAAAADAGTALEAFNPGHAGFQALKAKLADLRAHRVPSAVPMARRNLGPDVTTQAIASLDDPPLARSPYSDPRLEGDIVANMERWRWLPAEIGERYVAVNIPEFRLRLYEGGRVVHEARVVTGKPETPTPIFSGLMEYAIVNPSWYVPPSILKKEFLPRMAEDPDYAARQGYEVVRRGRSISIRQPPGEKNALGFIKFMFPNQHAVYLHDTPSRRLFGQTRRAFSHGCVRVDQPFALADFVLGAAWSEARLKRLIGRGERTIWLPQKLPVHLTYFTVTVDGSGELRTFEDIYGHNRRVRTALGL